MKRDTPEARSRAAALVAVLILVAVTALYVVRARPAADRNLAGIAIDALETVEEAVRALPAGSSAQTISNALGDNSERADTFLISDSAKRMPIVAANVESALRAQVVANQVWVLSDRGDTNPPLDEIAQGILVAEECPAFAAHVRPDGAGTLRVDNAQGQAVSALMEFARSKTDLAAGALDTAR